MWILSGFRETRLKNHRKGKKNSDDNIIENKGINAVSRTKALTEPQAVDIPVRLVLNFNAKI